MKKGKQYRIEWVDIHTDNNWTTIPEVLEEVKKLKTITNNWFYLGKIGDWRIFSSGVSKDKEPLCFDWVAVPNGVIKKITLIK